LSIAAQVREPEKDDFAALNARIQWQINNPARRRTRILYLKRPRRKRRGEKKDFICQFLKVSPDCHRTHYPIS
jgi:hypothetical protein